MKNYSLKAVQGIIDNHLAEMKLADKYLEACKQVNDKQGIKDFSRLLNEHGAAWYRYRMMQIERHSCNLNVVMPDSFYRYNRRAQINSNNN